MNLQMLGRTMRWLGPAVISVAGLVLIFGNPISLSALCDGSENCPATWVGALSGWAALAGALLTIGVMREQLLEQRRQTDHVRGEIEPEAFVEPTVHQIDHDYFSEARITIINRNRRPLNLHRIEVAGPPDVDLGIRMLTVEGRRDEVLLSQQLQTKYIHRTIPGKEDGHKAERCVIDCHITFKKELARLSRDADDWNDVRFTVTVYGWFKDATNIQVKLVTSGEVSI